MKLTAAQLGTSDIVIEYTGDEPDLAFTDVEAPYTGANERWIVVKPYFVEHRWNADRSARTEVAYFSSTEISHRWAERKSTYPALTPYSRINIRTAALESSIGGTTTGKVTEGKTTLLGVKLMRTHETCEHRWGGWQRQWAPTCTVAGQDFRTCLNDSEHVELREVAALGHSWGAPSYTWEEGNGHVTACATCTRDSSHALERTVTTTYAVTKQPTATEAGTGVYTATFADGPFTRQTKTVEIPATGGAVEVDPGTDPGVDPGDTPGDDPGDTDQAHQHDWGAWTTIVPATCTETGVQERVCKTAFRSLTSGGVKVYRMYNKTTKAYLLTKKASEVKSLKKSGWKSQGAIFRASN